MALPAPGTTPPSRVTVRPTGLPSWPFIVCAGREGTGKTWFSVEASSSPLVGRTFLVEVGEGQSNEYGSIPGANYEIVPTDGTYRDILNAVWWATAQKWVDDKPNLVILDSGSVLWDLLCAEAQEVANRRAKIKAEKFNKPITAEDADISMDLWNVAKKRWMGISDLMRYYRGPAIMTARMEEVVVVVNGQPTKEKDWKVKAEKSLPFNAGCVLEWKEVRKPVLTKLVSVKYPVPVGGQVSMDRIGDGLGTFHSLVVAMGLDTAKVTQTGGSDVTINPTAGADEIDHEEIHGPRKDVPNPRQMAAQRIADLAVDCHDVDTVRQAYVSATNDQLLPFVVTSTIGTGPLGELLKHVGTQLAARAVDPTTSPAPATPKETSQATASEPLVPQEPSKETAVVEETAPVTAPDSQSAPKPVVASDPPQKVAAEKATAKVTANATAAGVDAIKQALLEEVKAQAKVMGIGAREFMGSLLPTPNADPRDTDTGTLIAWVVDNRKAVVAKLYESGLDKVAKGYDMYSQTQKPVNLGSMISG